MSVPILVKVNIRSLAVGGDGVGEVVSQDDNQEDMLGITAFVPFTAAGEKVTARVVNRKDRYVKTELVSVDESSMDRVLPECKHYENCGGCELQHISYHAQLAAKYEMVRGSLRAGRLDSLVLDTLKEVYPSNSYGYRRRVTLHIDPHGRIGFYRSSSRSVVGLDECPISVTEISSRLPDLKDFGTKVQGKISSVILDADKNGVIAVLKAPYALASTERTMVLDVAKQFFDNVCLRDGEKETGGFGRKIIDLPLTESGSLTLRIPAGHFSQVNAQINIELISQVIKKSGIKRGSTVYDLYSGAGNFSLPMARVGANVVAVENDPQLVSFGKENALRYHFDKQIQYVESSVEKFIPRQRGKKVDVIVADPPRSGLGSLATELGGLSNKLILISCHLPSCVRDIKTLIDHGWRVLEIQPFDMFAQTSYVEVMTVLER
jgi:23S rRNA (uracil1939-C5)-methyltransferase